jgi:hypothetical protein
MVGVEGLAQGEKYQHYAEEAHENAKRASSEGDRVAWLVMERSWRSLLPLLDDPAKPHRARVSVKMPLVGRLRRLRRLRSTRPSGKRDEWAHAERLHSIIEWVAMDPLQWAEKRERPAKRWGALAGRGTSGDLS